MLVEEETKNFSSFFSKNNFLLKRKGKKIGRGEEKEKQFYDFKISSLGNSILR